MEKDIYDYIEEYGVEQVYEAFRHDSKFRAKMLGLIAAGLIGGSMAHQCVDHNFYDTEEKIYNIMRTDVSKQIPDYEKKVAEVRRCMEASAANGGGVNLIRMSPEFVLNLCAITNYDVLFFLTQTHWESHNGTTKAAQKWNNPFSYGLTDKGPLFAFNSQEDAAQQHIILMKSDYLINGKTPASLMRPGQFVNYAGKRYASDKQYESNLAGTYAKYRRLYPDLINIWGDDPSNNPFSSDYDGPQLSMADSNGKVINMPTNMSELKQNLKVPVISLR